MSLDNLKKNIILTPFNILYKFSPKKTLEILFRLKLGYPLNLHNPQTYNEKIQWIKLYDHNPLMPKCCDKYAVREYIENKGYGRLINTLLWEGFPPAAEDAKALKMQMPRRLPELECGEAVPHWFPKWFGFHEERIEHGEFDP